MAFAPIALFVYNRPWHTRQTVEALTRNQQAGDSDLFVFSDAGKNASDTGPVGEVRGYIREIGGFKSVTIVERTGNYGLSRAVISGVSEVLADSDTVIVVEDDLVTSPYFLNFMNAALAMYRDDPRVISIHGYVYPVGDVLPETFFLKGADCWGWGTWKRGWDLFDRDGRHLLDQLKARKLTDRFDFHGAYPFTLMLRDQISGKTDSWAVRWYASALLNDMFTLYPGRPLVQNIGTDNSGTNCGKTSRYQVEIASEPIALARRATLEEESVVQFFERFFRSCRPSLYRRLLGRLGLGGR